KRCMVKRIEADAPGPRRYQHKRLVETHEVGNQGGRTVVQPYTHAIPIAWKRRRKNVVTRYDRRKLFIEFFVAYPFVVFVLAEIPKLRMTTDACHIRIHPARHQETPVLRQMQGVAYPLEKCRLLIFDPIKLHTRVEAAQCGRGR